MLPSGYSYQIGQNQDGDIAKAIIFSVLHEYGLGDYTHHTDTDLDAIELAYQGGFFGLIKNESGQFVGTFGLFRLSSAAAEIRKMYLLPEARGKGIGKWMVHFLIQKAIDFNYQKIELETASVLEEAMQLYKKLGFVEVTASNASPRCDRAFELKL